MVLLQHKLNLKVTQKQILTPGLVQMVSVLALNKLELREMINAEMVENPVLEELDSSVPLLDEVAGREEARDREEAQNKDRQEVKEEAPAETDKKDPFDEIDFGSFFRDYLDPGYRNSADLEEIERPSFENFLSKPATLTDHLMWQLGAISVRPEVRAAAELVIGNLNERRRLSHRIGRGVAGAVERRSKRGSCGREKVRRRPFSGCGNGPGDGRNGRSTGYSFPRAFAPGGCVGKESGPVSRFAV